MREEFDGEEELFLVSCAADVSSAILASLVPVLKERG